MFRMCWDLLAANLRLPWHLVNMFKTVRSSVTELPLVREFVHCIFLCEFILSTTKIGFIILVALTAQNLPVLRSCKKDLFMCLGIICQPVCVILSASLNEKVNTVSTSLPYILSHKTSYKTVLSQQFFPGHLFWP